jgi:hypothetical protein
MCRQDRQISQAGSERKDNDQRDHPRSANHQVHLYSDETGWKKCQQRIRCVMAHTIKAAYTIEPGVTFFILFNSACGCLVFVLFGAERLSLADVGAVNMCLKN